MIQRPVLSLFALALALAASLYFGERSEAGVPFITCGATCRPTLSRADTLAVPEPLSRLATVQAARDELRDELGADRRKFFGAGPAGTWEDVDGYFTFAYFYPTVGDLDLLIRGFPAVRVPNSNDYRVEEWDRSAYWLEVDGNPPRLLQALELSADFVPETGQIFADNPDVVATCTSGAGCTLNFVAYFRYRQSNAAPNAYQDLSGAFVTDGEGDAIDFVLFIEDAQGNVTGNERLTAGDQIELNLLGFRIEDPEFIFAISYAPALTLHPDTTAIRRANYVPGVDFADSTLPPDLNAGARRIRLILDASNGAGEDYSDPGPRSGTFAYGGPFPLAFTWGQAADYLHRDGLERPLAVTQAPPAPIVQGAH